MIFQPGVYYVGDPCYAIEDDIWLDFCHELEKFNDGGCYQGERDLVNGGFGFDFQGEQVWCSHTSWGDGGYFDQDDREFLVDAGLIGVVPANLIAPQADDDATIVHGVTQVRGGHIIKFDTEFTCESDTGRAGDGTIRIGNIVIDTDPSDPEADEWDDDEWGDDDEDEDDY